LSFELPSTHAAHLEREAKRLGVSVEDLARAAVADWQRRTRRFGKRRSACSPEFEFYCRLA
jgi:hypothetical protein